MTRWCRRSVVAGLLLAVIAYFLPRQAGDVTLSEDESVAVDDDVVLRLERFFMPLYPSGRPRQYVCQAKVSSDAGAAWRDAEISVNHPLRLNGWWIYQTSYAADADGCLTTHLQCVREPGFPLAVAGWALALLGALGLCRKAWDGSAGPAPRVAGRTAGAVLRVAFALAVVALPVFVIGRAVLRPEPVPALQSPLMAPHVAAYAASYLILLFAAFGIGRRLLPVGYLLMTLGLVLGAWWGKMVWGAWWQCDPKEMWSLATWLVYTAYFFCDRHPRAELALRIFGAVMVILTLTVANYSRLFTGLHTYAFTDASAQQPPTDDRSPPLHA